MDQGPGDDEGEVLQNTKKRPRTVLETIEEQDETAIDGDAQMTGSVMDY